jgi:hypothetical protein
MRSVRAAFQHITVRNRHVDHRDDDEQRNLRYGRSTGE